MLLTAIGAVTVAFALIAVVALVLASHMLHASDQPEHADLIVVLSGAPERTVYAAELVTRGFTSTVYLSKPERERSHRLVEEYGFVLPTEEQVNRAILIKKGVAVSQIHVFPRSSVNTMDEARGALAAIPPDTKTMMIVTSAYHTRRARMTFNKIFAGRTVKLVVVASPYDPYPERWWSTQESARQTVLELTKIVFFLLGGSYSGDPAVQ